MSGQLITPGFWGSGNKQGAGGQLVNPYANTGSGSTLINPYLPTSQSPFQFWQKPVYTAADGSLWCPGVEGATYAANETDRVFIAFPFDPPLEQPFTPGICSVRVRKPRDVDRKKAAGGDGQRNTIHGVNAAEVDIDIQIWTPEQFRRLYDLWTVLFPVGGKGAPPAFDVDHPVLRTHKVRSLQFVDGEGPNIDGKRVGHFLMRAVEFQPPVKGKNATNTAVQSIGSLFDKATTTYPTPGSNSANTGP